MPRLKLTKLVRKTRSRIKYSHLPEIQVCAPRGVWGVIQPGEKYKTTAQDKTQARTGSSVFKKIVLIPMCL